MSPVEVHAQRKSVSRHQDDQKYSSRAKPLSGALRSDGSFSARLGIAELNSHACKRRSPSCRAARGAAVVRWFMPKMKESGSISMRCSRHCRGACWPRSAARCAYLMPCATAGSAGAIRSPTFATRSSAPAARRRPISKTVAPTIGATDRTRLDDPMDHAAIETGFDFRR